MTNRYEEQTAQNSGTFPLRPLPATCRGCFQRGRYFLRHQRRWDHRLGFREHLLFGRSDYSTIDRLSREYIYCDEYRRICFQRLQGLDLGDDSRVGDEYRGLRFRGLQGLDLGNDRRVGDQYRYLGFLGLHGLDLGDDSRGSDQYRWRCFQGLHGLDLGDDSRVGDEYRGLCFLGLHRPNLGDDSLIGDEYRA